RHSCAGKCLPTESTSDFILQETALHMHSASLSVCNVKFHRAVVRSHHICQDLRILKPVLQAFRYTEIINTPSCILRPGAEPVGPPGIDPGLIRIKIAERVNESRIEKFGELLPLFIRKPGISPVCLRILQVDLLVGNVHITCYDDRLLLLK